MRGRFPLSSGDLPQHIGLPLRDLSPRMFCLPIIKSLHCLRRGLLPLKRREVRKLVSCWMAGSSGDVGRALSTVQLALCQLLCCSGQLHFLPAKPDRSPIPEPEYLR
jgi:hypothetical protein